MSFSSEVKAEVNKLNNLANKEAVKYELFGYISTNHILLEKNKLKFSTENEYNINRFGKLLSNLNYTNYEIEMVGKNFCIKSQKPILEEIEYKDGNIVIKPNFAGNANQKEMLEKAFVRGSFLGAGSISNPKNTYHLEILFNTEENAKIVENILNNYGITFKILKKKNDYSLYTKDGNKISEFLALIGANTSVLQFEDIRVYRDIRNNVNRKVNCETANLNKIVNASVSQVKAINYLQQIGEFEKLSEGLQEIALLRLENPEASLTELGELLPITLGKSGVNHRLKAIEKIAEEIKGRK